MPVPYAGICVLPSALFFLFLRILGEGGTKVIVQIREGRIFFSFLLRCVLGDEDLFSFQYALRFRSVCRGGDYAAVAAAAAVILRLKDPPFVVFLFSVSFRCYVAQFFPLLLPLLPPTFCISHN